MTVQSYYGANPEKAKDEFNEEDMARHAYMAGVEHRTFFDLPDGVGAEAVALMREMATAAHNTVSAFGSAHGLTDEQISGVMLSLAFGALLDTVDDMRSEYHPTLRAIYLNSLLRLLQARALVSALNKASEQGFKSPNDDKGAWDTIDSDPFPMDALVKAALSKDEMKAAKSIRDVPEVMQVVNLLSSLAAQVANPDERAHLTGRVDALRKRFGLEVESDGATMMGAVNVEDSPAGMREAAEQISKAMGGCVSTEQVLESIKQARESGSRMAVLELPKRRGD